MDLINHKLQGYRTLSRSPVSNNGSTIRLLTLTGVNEEHNNAFQIRDWFLLHLRDSTIEDSSSQPIYFSKRIQIYQFYFAQPQPSIIHVQWSKAIGCWKAEEKKIRVYISSYSSLEKEGIVLK